MKAICSMRRNFSLLLIVLLTVSMLVGCGGKGPDATTGGAASGVETVPTNNSETVPETTVGQREVTIVGDSMRHMNFNIAGSNTLERIPNFDLNENKRNNMKTIIEQIDPDTFGIQEAPQAWIEGMVPLLDNKYAMVGGYSEQIGKNEKFWYNPLYYKVDVFNCLDSGVLFLTDDFTYQNNNRNMAFALLERKADGELILLMSTHLEHRALGTEDLETYNYTTYYEKTAEKNILRDHQVDAITKAITAKLAEYASYGKEISVVISGDFNINAWQDEQFTHEYTRLCETMLGIRMFDTVNVAANVQPNQTKAQWQTYRDYFTTSCPNARLDYIFVSENVMVSEFAVYNTPYEIGDSSDHHPVYADYHIGH